MPAEKEFEARKARLMAQIAALRAKHQEMLAARRQMEAKRKIEERRMNDLERMTDTIETRAEEAEEQLDEAEQGLEEAEEEYEECADEDEREMPDLSHIESKVRKAMDKLNKVNLAGLGEAISVAVNQSMAAGGLAGRTGFDVERMRQELGGRSNTVMTRISDEDLATLDTLVDAGLASSRSECAAMFVHEGIIARRDLIDRVKQKADQIRRLKDSMRDELKSIGGAKVEEGRRSALPPAPPVPPTPPAPPRAPAPPVPSTPVAQHPASGAHADERVHDHPAEGW